ncbi:hypothetical protein [Nitrosomonas mobilis]
MKRVRVIIRSQQHRSKAARRDRRRARVEHVFGSMTDEISAISIRTIGCARAKVQIGLLSLIYIIKRVVTRIRKKDFSCNRIIEFCRINERKLISGWSYQAYSWS